MPYRHQQHAWLRTGRTGIILWMICTLVLPPTWFTPRATWAAFIAAPAERMPTTAATHYGMAVGDVDGNQTPDVIIAVGGQSRLLLNDGHGRFTEGTSTHLPRLDLTAMAPILCDVDGDGDLDLILANAAGRNRLLLNDGRGRFVDETTSRLPNQSAVSMQLACGDVDGDGDRDLVVANRGSQNWLWRNNGHGVFTDVTETQLPRASDLSYAVRLADVDGDRTLDLVVINHKQPQRLWSNNGLGVFTDVTATHLPGAASDSNDGALVDVDGDGDLDLCVATGREGLRLWLNDGYGVFTEATATHLPTLGVFGIKVATGDIDGDGTLDLVLATARQSQVLLNDGTGHFRNATADLLPVDARRSFGLAVFDVEGDLDLDILLATPNGPLRLWLNETTVPRLRVAVVPTALEVGKPVTLTVEAFDEDGLAAAALTLTDPGRGTQTVDLVTDLADRHATYTFTSTQTGPYTATATVTDPLGRATVRHIAFTVQSPDVTAPQVTVTVVGPTSVLVGQPVPLRVTATDDRGVARTTLMVQNTPVPMASDGTATYTPTAAGLHTVVAQATDAAGNVGTGRVTFAVAADTTAPAVTVTVTPPVVDLAQPVAITVSATDNVAITSRALRVTGPAIPDGLALTLDVAGRATYTPFQPGTYTLTATAQDPSGRTGTGTATFTAQGVPDTTPPVVQLSGVPATSAVGRPLTMTVSAIDNVRVTSTILLINDTPQPLDAAGRVIYTPRVVGTYTVVAVAQDAVGNQSRVQATFQAIEATQDTEPPVVAIAAPAEDAMVTAPSAVRGTVRDATLVRWTLAYSPHGEGRFTTLAAGATEVAEGVLGTFDPTLLPNDLYDLRLTAEDASGRVSTTAIVVRVTGRMKVGHLSFAVEDLTVPLFGLPITITRTYDSRDTTPGDFGVGWRLDVQTLKVRKNRVLGTGWQQGRVSTFQYCVEPHGAHYVTIALPDGRTEAFDVTLNPACQMLIPVQETTVTFTAQPGTFSRLEAITENTVQVVGGLATGVGSFAPVELVHADTQGNLGHYDPTAYRLTTSEGLIFDLDQTFGVRRVTDSSGNTLMFARDGIHHTAGTGVAFTRDAQDRITRIIDPNGNVLTYTYDAAGDLVAVTDPAEQTTQYAYDGAHRLAEMIDPRGRPVARHLYDEAGRLTAHIDAEGHRIDYTHNIAGRQEILRDRRGHTTAYTYDEQGNVLSTIDALGHTTTFTYDARGNQLTAIDALGHTTTFTYDARGNLLTQTDALGRTTAYTYNSRGQVLTSRDPLGQTTTHTYDQAGHLLTATDPSGYTTHYTYNSRGGLHTVTDSLGHTTTYAYDQAGRVVRETSASGHVTAYTYDANGNQLTRTTTRTDGQGMAQTMTIAMAYGGHNRVVQTVDADGHATFVAYNAMGKPAATIDAHGQRTDHAYDARGHLMAITLADGTAERFTYDAHGNQVSFTDRAGNTTHYVYDALGRLTRTIFPDGSTSGTTYDALGREMATTDAHGMSTTYVYDAVGNKTQAIDALGYVTTYTYDANNNIQSISDAQGQTTRFTHTPTGLLASTLFPDGSVSTTTYDGNGQNITETDQAGQTTRFVSVQVV